MQEFVVLQNAMRKKIGDIKKEYYKKLDPLDLDLLIADSIKKSKEFVLTYPEYEITSTRNSQLVTLIKRRLKHEPLAYILGHKEFFGLDFKVTPDTLIPRPETELLVEFAIQEIQNIKQKVQIIDIGTGSGNIIISLAKHIKNNKLKFFGTDISPKALKIAKCNAKIYKVDKKITFLKGNLLEPILKSKKFITHNSELIILSNLPYLSKEIYSSTPVDIKKYEPKSALLSGSDGLNHYRKLFQQIKKVVMSYELRVTIFLEISPEQKPALQKIIKSSFSKAEFEFKKDLAGKWRICIIHIIA
jgi:release factor glutamine methyltransferase